MGKSPTSWNSETRPAPKTPGRKKGSKNRLTKVKELMGKSNWAYLKTYIETEGIEKLIKEMDKLKGKDYVNAWYHLAEYIKPKLHRDLSPKDTGGDTIQNNYFLTLPIEVQRQIYQAMTQAQRAQDAPHLEDTPPQLAAPGPTLEQIEEAEIVGEEEPARPGAEDLERGGPGADPETQEEEPSGGPGDLEPGG